MHDTKPLSVAAFEGLQQLPGRGSMQLASYLVPVNEQPSNKLHSTCHTACESPQNARPHSCVALFSSVASVSNTDSLFSPA